MEPLRTDLVLAANNGRQQKSSVESLLKDAANNCGGMDREIFVDLMKYLWAMTSRRDFPDRVVLLGWYIAMRDLTEQDLVTAIDRYIRERSSEFPSPQLLRELSGVQSTKAAANAKSWDSLIAAIKHFGAYQTPRFKDPLIPVVIRHLGGWIKVCDTPTEELHKWTRQTFEKTYAALSNEKHEPARLTNMIDVENSRTGMTEVAAEVQKLITMDQNARRLHADGLILENRG